MEKPKKRSELQPMKSSCVDCGNPFNLTTEEISRNKEKKIPLPARCRACRRSKLIELKLKRLTKLIFKILNVVEQIANPGARGFVRGKLTVSKIIIKKKHEPKLPEEQKERVATQEKS